MKPNLPLTLAGYLVAAYLVFVPLLETGMTVFPPGLAEAGWRYGAIGTLTQALMTPLLGVLVAVGLAHQLEHRRVMRFVAVAGGVAACVVLALIPVFIMDSIVMRGRFEEAQAAAVNATTGSAVLKMLVTGVIGLAVSRGGWMAAGSWGVGGQKPLTPDLLAGRAAASRKKSAG